MSRVTEGWNTWGNWTLNLADTCPGHLLQAASPSLHGGALIRIYPGRIEPSHLDDLMPLWTGIILTQTNQGRTLGGPGPEWYLGTGGDHTATSRDSSGAFTIAPITLTNAHATTWLETILTATVTGLTAGTHVLPLPGTLVTATHTGRNARTLIDSWMRRRFGLGYRVNPDLTVSLATQGSMWGQTTATTPIATRRGGRDNRGRGIQVQTLDLAVDATDHTTGTVAWYDNGAIGATGDTDWRNPQGQPLNWRRLVDRPSIDLTEATRLANSLQADATIERSSSMTSRDYAVTSQVRPGEHVDIWDPAAGFVNLNRSRHHEGEIIHPARLRVSGVSWPVTEGMSVWLDRRHLPAGTLDELTPHVQFEPDDAETRWTLGARGRRIGQT